MSYSKETIVQAFDTEIKRSENYLRYIESHMTLDEIEEANRRFNEEQNQKLNSAAATKRSIPVKAQAMPKV